MGREVSAQLSYYNDLEKRRRVQESNTRAYNARREILKSLGFELYKDYLESDLWLGIRSKVLDAFPFCRICCWYFAKQVHHQNYRIETMSGKDVSGLIALCSRCHRRIEFSHRNKRSFQDTVKHCQRGLQKSGRSKVSKTRVKLLSKKFSISEERVVEILNLNSLQGRKVRIVRVLKWLSKKGNNKNGSQFYPEESGHQEISET